MTRRTLVSVAITLLMAGGAVAQNESGLDQEMPYTFLRAEGLWRDGRPTPKGMEVVRAYDRRHPNRPSVEDRFRGDWLTEARSPFLLEALARLEPLEKECAQWAKQADALGGEANETRASARGRLVILRLAICNELLDGYQTVIRRVGI
jgi:hypothetical protein